MKIFIIAILLSLGFVPAAMADTGHDVSVSDALQGILTAQNVSDISKADCGQVSDKQFEVLGDASMANMHAEEEHELMDQMMGGEGSDSLQAMHIRMGQGYLGCYSGSGVMSGGMMSGGRISGSTGNFSMHGGLTNFSYPIFHYATMILLWLTLLLVIAAAIKYLVKEK